MSLHRISAASSAVLCSIVLTTSALAQGGDHVDQTGPGAVSIPEEQKQALRERNRASLHPGDPLVIVGVEQGDNEIRSRTPALLNSDRNSTKLNDDVAYQRKLALYEGGGHKLQSFESARPIPEKKNVAHRARQTETVDEPAKKRPILAVVIGLLASAFFSIWAFKRYANLFMRSGA